MLPKEKKGFLNSTVMRAVWTNKLIVGALGLHNEHEAREWFRAHPHVHAEFDQMNAELGAHIEALQLKARDGLQAMVVAERHQPQAYAAYDDMDLDLVKAEEPDIVFVKEEKVDPFDPPTPMSLF